MPHAVDGLRIDAVVSEPMAKVEKADATQAPGPVEEPWTQWSSFHGLCTGPLKVPPGGPPASSLMLSFPRRTAPESLSRSMTAASWSGTWSAKTLQPQVVRMFLVDSRSLTANGIPCSGPR